MCLIATITHQFTHTFSAFDVDGKPRQQLSLAFLFWPHSFERFLYRSELFEEQNNDTP
jgi:hypothetical protein